MLDKIKKIIESAIPDSEAIVSDPFNDGQHFQAIVISASFENLSLVKQHQMVMNALKSELETDLHALSLKTFVPEKWKSEKNKH